MRSITEKKASLSAGVKKILETISTYDNIPRKKAKFMNFMTNSFRYMKHNELDEAWTLLEEAMKDSKAEHKQQNGNAVNGNAKQINGEEMVAEEAEPEKHTNGRAATNGEAKQTNGKRKLIEEADEVVDTEPATKKKKKEAGKKVANGEVQQTNGKQKLIEETDEVEESEPAAKKKKKEAMNGSAENGDQPAAADSNDSFNWKETIRTILSAKNNELKLKKLKKKVETKYRSFTGTEWSDKIESKFNKKIKKLTRFGIVVDNDQVRLID